MKHYYLLIIPVALALGILIISCIWQASTDKAIDTDAIINAEKLAGLTYTNMERDSLVDNLIELEGFYRTLRQYEIGNDVPPAFLFSPLPVGFVPPPDRGGFNPNIPDDVVLPDDPSQLAYYPVYKLASLVRHGKITSTELTLLYLHRLEKYGDELHCVVTITRERALMQAQKADADLARGIYHGPLHGIPYGVKDLLAVEGYKTTWGAMPYKDQSIDETALLVRKLDDAGAVLVAKLSMGALAMGDVWFNGISRNPWDTRQGSSGSSAGSASATAAGLVGFSIGTETYGSIVSPSTRCGVTGLRPTFGRVSRDQAMALSWTMDKIGPICRTAYDCALVLDVIRGFDPNDPGTCDAAFDFNGQRNIKDMKVAYIKNFFDDDYPGKINDSLTLDIIRKSGIDLVPVGFPGGMPVEEMIIILLAEAAAAFDQLTQSDQDDLLVAQHREAWPNIFRYAQFIPAVEYIHASRLRSELIEQMHAFLQPYDVVITPTFGGDQLLATNLTGQPCVVIPNGFDQHGHPTGISLIGNLFDEAILLEFADYLQQITDWDEMHPEEFQ